MAISSEKVFQSLPIEQQKEINIIAEELIQEYQLLHNLPKTHQLNENDVIILEPDVKKYFPDSESVNKTLRNLIKLIPKQ